MRLQSCFGSAIELRARRFALLACWAVVAVHGGFAPAPLAMAQGAPDFALPADAATPVLVMRQTPTELGDAAAVELRIFADGRCHLHRPPMMRGAGDHSWSLSRAEVRALVRQALVAGLADLDAKRHRAALRTRAASNVDAAVQHFRFDDDTVEFEIAVDAYRPGGRGAARDVRRSIEWRSLRGDRARHPSDDVVRQLVELRDQLDAMSRARAPLDPGA